MGVAKSKSNQKQSNITQTLMISLKKNRIVESPHKKKTSFLELFFDLAIVFVFTTLSSRFADYMGISPKIFIGESDSVEVTHAEIGLFYWIINFLALWQVWYRYGVLFRNYGNEGVLSHFLTFSLIIGIGMQAITLTIDTEFFARYGLLISFAISKMLLYLFEVLILVSAHRKGKDERANIRKVLYETIGLGIFFVLTAIYVALSANGNIGVIKDGAMHDDWQIQLMISAIISITVLVDLFVSLVFHTKTVQMSEMKIYAHTKERHHLLVIIALGESVLFNIGKGAVNETDLIKIIPELILNLLIIMAMWYIYKIYLYRVSYAKGSFNVTIFGVVHIFIIAGMMLMFSSLEAYAEAQTEWSHLHHIQESLPSAPTFIALRDLEHAMHITYPTIYMSGFGVFMITVICSMWLLHHGHEAYDKVIAKKRVPTTIAQILVLVGIGIIWTILILGVKFALIYIFAIMLVLLFIEFIVGIYLTNYHMLKITGSEKKAIEELEQLEK